MKLYIVMDEETGESDSLDYVASSLEKAIEHAQKQDQFLYERNVYEMEIDTEFVYPDPLYTQIQKHGKPHFVGPDGFLTPVK